MECYKAEAMRAKLMAEDLLNVGDITGARNFALRAQEFFPNLEGLSQLLGVVNILYAHEHTINGEVDYYGILGVDPSADEEFIRKQYKRLALFVHPDKNKSSRAGDAFTILFEAHRVLSNKDERSSYDMKLNLRAPAQIKIFGFTVHATCPRPESAPSQSFSSPYMPYGTQFQYTPSTTSHYSTPPPPQEPIHQTPGKQESSRRSPPPQEPIHQTPGNHESSRRSPPPETTSASRTTFRYSRFKKSSARPETFWTGCDRCRIKFEFKKIILDQEIQCPRCLQPFLAVAMPAPSAARGQPSTEQAERGPENLGSTSAPCTDSGGHQTEKPAKRRRKDDQGSDGEG